MGNGVIYSTNIEVKGPWLLDEESLLALDKVMDEQEQQLTKANEDQRTAAIDAHMAEWVSRRKTPPTSEQYEEEKKNALSLNRYPFNRYKRHVVLFLKGGKTLRGDRLGRIFKQPLEEQELPTGFTYELEVGDVKGEIAVPRYSTPVLSVSVAPQEDSGAQEFFGALSNWVAKNKPGKWQQRWLKGVDFFRAFWLMWPVMFLLFWLGGSNVLSEKASQSEAVKLIQNGVQPGQEREALRQILIVQTKYTNGPVSFYRPGLGFWLPFALGGFVITALCFAPGVEIGVWAGRKRVEKWRRATQFVMVTVPSFLIGAVVVPIILKQLGWA